MLESAATGTVEILLDPGVRERIAVCHEFALRGIGSGRPVYVLPLDLGRCPASVSGRTPRICARTLFAGLTVGQVPDLDSGTVRSALAVRLASLCYLPTKLDQIVRVGGSIL